LHDGIVIDGIRYGPIEATADRAQGANVWMTFAIREGKNREVKNVLGHLGLAVNRLIRVSFGPFKLDDLAPGEIEEVRTRTLREQLGARIAASIGADFSGPLRENSESKRGIPSPPELGLAKIRHIKVEVGERSEPYGGRPQRSRGSKALLPGEGSAPKPRRSKAKRGGGFGPIGEPERARQEKRRSRRASRGKRR
jgi:23S rRNA pseudouridine2605 synthase